jgi:predicted TIM-barrel fold metal-dependent hydrolase
VPNDSTAWDTLAKGKDIIDAHAHVGPWYNFFTPEPDAAGMVRAMDRCEVKRAAISSMLAIGPDAVAGNRETLEVVRRYPDRFVGYAVFNPHQRGSRSDVERMLQERGIVGIKMHPVTHEYPLSGPDYEPVWALASQYDVPVLTHTEAGSPVSDPALVVDVATRWPDVRIILGHAGVTDAGHRTAISLAREHPNLFLELCGSFTTGVWIRRMVDAIGPERVVYGSDFPFIDLRYGLGRVLFAGLPPADLAMVLGGNACRLLKLEED